MCRPCHDYIDKMRPVTVKDCYVVAPIKQFIDITIANLMPGTAEVAGAIEASVRDMLHQMAAPGQTIYAAWVCYAIMNAPGVQSFNLVTTDDYVMPSLGHMAVLGTILYDTPTTLMSDDRHVRRIRRRLRQRLSDAAAAGAGVAEATRHDARSRLSRPRASTGALSIAAPPTCWSTRATRARPSSCCRTGSATGACPIPATKSRRPSASASSRWSCG